MSKSNKFEQIGRISASVIALPEKHLGVTLDIVNKLHDPRWKARLTQVIREGLASNCLEKENLFNPSEYFVTRQAVPIVENEFVSRILSVHNKPVEKRGLEGVEYIDILRGMNDIDIINEYLGGKEKLRKYAFTPDQIADLIDQNMSNKDGGLTNNGRANIFYVIGENDVLFAVYVSRLSNERCLEIFPYYLDGDNCWDVGTRIFYNTK